MNDHPAKLIKIKEELIDIKMIPIIKWLNGFDDITTRWCCQGNKKENPYVVFFCESMLTLSIILKKVEVYATINVHYYEGCIRYNMKFNNPQMLMEFNKFLFKDSKK